MPEPRSNRCYLLELPPELRLCIYDLVFPPRSVDIGVDANVYRWRSYNYKGSMSFLATCSLIRHEATPIFHNNTTVHFSIWDESERPLSRYYRFATLRELNATAFSRVRKVHLSLHTLTEPIWPALHAHLRGLLARLGYCASVRALEIHFEFWSTISDAQLYQIYETLCEIDYNKGIEIRTRKTGSWTVLYRSDASKQCLRMVQDDIAFKRQGLPLLMQSPEIGATVGPRELVISSAS